MKAILCNKITSSGRPVTVLVYFGPGIIAEQIEDGVVRITHLAESSDGGWYVDVEGTVLNRMKKLEEPQIKQKVEVTP